MGRAARETRTDHADRVQAITAGAAARTADFPVRGGHLIIAADFISNHINMIGGVQQAVQAKVRDLAPMEIIKSYALYNIHR